MSIEVRLETDIAVIKPCGRIDVVNLPEFSAALKRSVRDRRKILIDFSQTEYMNSSGLRQLLESHRDATEASKIIALCSPSGELLELFRVVHLDKSFTIYQSDFEAFDAMLD
ncbi:MAG: anti-sigma factor antagonist [bacterium]|nr:anti-sigma factor antagonist [bacterium]